MTNTYKTSAQTTGLNVEGNEIVLPDGSLAVADNALISRENIIEQRFGFRKCGENLPASKPESMFVTGDNIYVHINNQLWTSSGNCTYTNIPGSSSVTSPAPYNIIAIGSMVYFIEFADVVRSINLLTSEVKTIAGTFGASGSTDGIGAAARFDIPQGIWGNSTYLYISDTGNYTIRRLEVSTNTVSTIAGTAGASGSADGVGAAARFNNAVGMWGDGTYIYICDSRNYTIRRLEIATNTVTTIAGTAGASGSTDGIGAAARFNQPYGIWGNGTYLYITDSLNSTIRRLEIATNTVTTIAGTAGVIGYLDGIGSAARFNVVQYINGDSTYLYIGDGNNRVIRRLEISNNMVTTVAGTPGVSGNIDGIGTAARFSTILGISSDSVYLYVCDSANNEIRRVNKSTAEVNTFVGYLAGVANIDGYLLSILSGPNG